MFLDKSSVALLALTLGAGLAVGQSSDPDEGFVTEYVFETQQSSNIAYVTMTGQAPEAESSGSASTEKQTNYETPIPQSTEEPSSPVSYSSDPESASAPAPPPSDSSESASSAPPSSPAVEPSSSDTPSSPAASYSSADTTSSTAVSSSSIVVVSSSESSTTVVAIGSNVSVLPTPSNNATTGTPTIISNQPSPSDEGAASLASTTKSLAGGLVSLAAMAAMAVGFVF